MSYRQLDINGKPLPRKGRTSRKPAERMVRGKPLHHYEIVVAISQASGKYSYKKRRCWLADDRAAEDAERTLRNQPAAESLTWLRAHDLWLARKSVSPGHRLNVERVVRKWCAIFGAGKTIEGTTLADFSQYTEDLSQSGKGRAGQIAHTQLLAIARWCRKRGLVDAIPFEHSPKPAARTSPRSAAPHESYRRLADGLPRHQSLLWQLLGLTGMRLGGACDLVEEDIGENDFSVVTKGRKRVTYPVTPSIRRIIEDAREWKRTHGFTDSPTLFCNSAGHRWTSTTYGRHIKNACKRIEIKPAVTPHQLRHLAGTIMAEGNLSADIIQAGLGHSSRESAEIYIDKTEKMRQEALAAVDKILTKNDKEMHKLAKTTIDEIVKQLTATNHVPCPFILSIFSDTKQ